MPAIFPSCQLYIVGDGPDRPAFELQASCGHGAERIHFEGFRSGPMAYMRAADIFVLASRREPFGLVLAEARAAGAAIVAADVDGIPEVLDGGRAGRLVPPGDVPALAQALRQLLADEGELAAWRARAGGNLDWLGVERMCRETCAVYDDALRGRPSAGAVGRGLGTRRVARPMSRDPAAIDPARCCIVSGSSEVRLRSFVNHKTYAAIHGHDYRFETGPFRDMQSNYFLKIHALEHVLPRYDWLLWMDDDAYFTDFATSALDTILAGDRGDAFLFACRSPVNARGQWTFLNSGVLLLRSCPLAHDFLARTRSTSLASVRRAWREDRYGMFTNGDQDVIIHLLHEMGLLGATRAQRLPRLQRPPAALHGLAARPPDLPFRRRSRQARRHPQFRRALRH